jgi:hypothetical protein
VVIFDGHGKIGFSGDGTLDEQFHRRVLGEGGDQIGSSRWQGAAIRQRQGQDREVVLASQAQHRPASDERFQPRRRCQQFGDRGGGCQHLFKVVEQEEQFFPPQDGLQDLSHRLPSCFSNSQHVGNGRDHKFRAADRGQPYEEHAAAERVEQLSRHL